MLKPVKPRNRSWEQSFLDTLRDTANVRLSAHKAGIDRTTAYRHRAKYTTFAAAWDEAIEDALDRIEARVFASAVDGDLQTARWFLSRRRPEVYGDSVALKHSGSVGTEPLKVEVVWHD